MKNGTVNVPIPSPHSAHGYAPTPPAAMASTPAGRSASPANITRGPNFGTSRAPATDDDTASPTDSGSSIRPAVRTSAPSPSCIGTTCIRPVITAKNSSDPASAAGNPPWVKRLGQRRGRAALLEAEHDQQRGAGHEQGPVRPRRVDQRVDEQAGAGDDERGAGEVEPGPGGRAVLPQQPRGDQHREPARDVHEERRPPGDRRVSGPPSSGPATADRPITGPIVPRAFARSPPSKRARMRPMISAAAASWAAAQASDASTKPVTPSLNTLARPRMSPSRPPMIRKGGERQRGGHGTPFVRRPPCFSTCNALHLDRAPFTRNGDVLGVSTQTVARRCRRLRAEASLRVVGLPDPQRTGQAEWMVRLTAGRRSA